jgi:hypothetical protein
MPGVRNAFGKLPRMTVDEAIAIAREHFLRAGVPIQHLTRVIDLDGKLAGDEQAAGQRLEERVRVRLAGRFVVWFKLSPRPDRGRVVGGDAAGVVVVKETGETEMLRG